MAGNELLDFIDRGNFDFFKFSTAGDSTHEERNLLKSKCQHVLEYAHATVQDMCLLGFNLSELKNSKTWQDVINPESGYAFLNHSFEEFCKHAFGFSETRTSNFLRIAQFVKISGDNVDFIEPQYAKYNTSQLVELAAVFPESRKFFNPDMTVKDMRAAKNYIKMGSFYKDRNASNFDLMQGMKAWEERKAEKESQKQDEGKNDQLPGQMSLENLENLTEVFEEDAQEKNSTSDLAEDDGEDFIEDVQPVMPEPQNWETEESEEETEDEPSAMDVYAPVAQQKEYSFNTREEFRAFLKDYANWENIGGNAFCENVYKYVFKNGITIFALEQRVYVYDVFGETIPMVTNMLQDEKGNRVVVYQDQIERFYRDYKGQLQ